MTEESNQAHHPLGPSTLKHVEICPSYRSANETNPIAEEGTLLHEACETRKLDGLSHEQQQLVALCLNYVDTLKEESTKVYLERKLQIHLLGPDEKHLASIIHFPNIFGTGDVIMCHEERNHIDLVDYKFGYGEIDDAEDNIQGQAYMVGVMDLFPWAETCAVHFIQPRRDEVSSHVFRRDDLEEVRFRLRLVVERATEPEPALNPEHDTCRFCHNRLSCPALRDRLLPIARKHVANDFAVDLLQKYSPSQVKDPEVLSKMMVVAPVMEKWAAEAKKHAAKVAQETGEDIPGYSLAYRSAPQRVKDAQLAYDVLKDNIDPEVFAEGCSVSLPALAKAYATANQIPVTKARGLIEGAFIQEGLLESDDDLEKIPYLRKK